MHKIFLLLSLLFIFAAVVFSQKLGSKVLTKRELAIKQIDATLDRSEVIEILKKCLLEIQRGANDREALSSSKYSIHCIRFGNCVKYRWFIADTGLSKKWFSDVYKLLKYMQKTRSIIETATINGYTQTAKYKQAVKYFDVAYKRFEKLAKKPVKVSGKSLRKAKIKKVLWQKAMRKKYKIERNSVKD